MAHQVRRPWYATAIDVIVLLDTALALAIRVTLGRGFFLLGRDGLSPSAFAKVSRFGTPWVGNLVMWQYGIVAIAAATPILGF